MKIIETLLLLVAICALAARAEASLPTTATPAWKSTPDADIALLPLDNAPFPHESRKDGFKAKAGFFPFEKHYNDPTVGFVIPRGFKPSANVDLIIHFHGHRNNVAKELERFRFAPMLNASGKNAILLLPQGPRDAPDSTCGRLEEPGALKKFVDEAIDDLIAMDKLPKGARVRNLVISGHSGAYRVMGFCVRHGGMEDHIRALWLWDSTYGQLEDFAGWVARPAMDQARIDALIGEKKPETAATAGDPATADATASNAGAVAGTPIPTGPWLASTLGPTGKSRQIFSIFTEHLAKNNGTLMTLLDKVGVSHGKWTDVGFDVAIGMALPVRFLATSLAHDDVMTKNEYFRKALEAAEFLESKK